MPTLTSTLSRSSTAERAHIAREIHDILSHSLGSLFVQLDAAETLLSEGGDADRGRYLVGEARRLAAEALAETRQAIAALRTGPVALPQALPAALAALTSADGRVSQQVKGSPRELHPDAGLALYRTAQEALANARKHAPGAPVAMWLSYDDHEVVLRVTNPAGGGNPSPLAATGGGYGLYGLRERAELLGGTLHAGPSEDGWVVELRVPAIA